MTNWICRRLYTIDPAVATETGGWPSTRADPLRRWDTHGGGGLRQPLADPVRDRDADRVPYKRPARTLSPAVRSVRRDGPVAVEALESLKVTKVRGPDESRSRNRHGWRRRYTKARATLDRRHGVCGPSEPAQAFSPVEPIGVTVIHWSDKVLTPSGSASLSANRTAQGSSVRAATRMTRLRRCGTPKARASRTR